MHRPSHADVDFAPPSLATARVRLRPIEHVDQEPLRQLELGEDLGIRWRYRGRTPGSDVYSQTLNAGVLAQFIVQRLRDNAPIGLVSIYNAEFQHGRAYLAAARFTRANPGVHFLEGVVLFVEYVFRCWPFRRLLLEVPEFNLPQIESGIGRLFVEEGVLADHWYYDGRYWSEHLLALTRDRWEESGWSGRIKRISAESTQSHNTTMAWEQG